MQNAKPASTGFSPEERRLRKRMIEMGIRQKDIADDLGIHIQNVSNVIRQQSRHPRYIAEVYNYMGLEQPSEEQDKL